MKNEKNIEKIIKLAEEIQTKIDDYMLNLK